MFWNDTSMKEKGFEEAKIVENKYFKIYMGKDSQEVFTTIHSVKVSDHSVNGFDRKEKYVGMIFYDFGSQSYPKKMLKDMEVKE